MPKLGEASTQVKKNKVLTYPTIKRKVNYPELSAQVNWLTVTAAKKLLGWKQAEQGTEFDANYLFKDRNGIPTRCYNVEMQRPFYLATALQWMGEILGGHWNGDGGTANGEAMIVSQQGRLLDGKHRMIGLVLAGQEWLKQPEKYPYWKEEPRIHCFINFGVREDMRLVNTLNTGKPRSLGDAIYASGLFNDMLEDLLKNDPKKYQRTLKQLSKMTDFAVRLLWLRTGAKRDAFAPRRSHAESLDFIQRHPKILQCVRHIQEENGSEGRLRVFPTPGYAAALLYLMGSANTIRENDEFTGYMQVDCPTEDLLDWSMWDTACDFWTNLAGGDERFTNLRTKVVQYVDEEGSSFLPERLACIIKAWWCYHSDLEITIKALDLDTHTNPDGIQILDETPLVGEMLGDFNSIDIGQLD